MDPPSWLQDRCRVCGGKLSRYKVSYDCHTTINKAKLQLIGVTIAGDQEGVHPPRFCYGRFEWGESSEVEHGRVGRKPKKAPIGRPSNLIKDLVTHMKEGAPPSVALDLITRERLSHHPSMDEDLKCLLCHLMLDRPLQLTTFLVRVVENTPSTEIPSSPHQL